MLAIGYSKDVIVLVIYEKITQFRLAEKGVQFSCDTNFKICNKSAITNEFNTKEDKCTLLWWVLALKKVRKS